MVPHEIKMQTVSLRTGVSFGEGSFKLALNKTKYIGSTIDKWTRQLPIRPVLVVPLYTERDVVGQVFRYKQNQERRKQIISLSLGSFEF